MPFDATMTQPGNMGASEILFGDNLSLMDEVANGVRLSHLHRPAIQYGQGPG